MEYLRLACQEKGCQQTVGVFKSDMELMQREGIWDEIVKCCKHKTRIFRKYYNYLGKTFVSIIPFKKG